jgi:hypothetical protein
MQSQAKHCRPSKSVAIEFSLIVCFPFPLGFVSLIIYTFIIMCCSINKKEKIGRELPCHFLQKKENNTIKIK